MAQLITLLLVDFLQLTSVLSQWLDCPRHFRTKRCFKELKGTQNIFNVCSCHDEKKSRLYLLICKNESVWWNRFTSDQGFTEGQCLLFMLPGWCHHVHLFFRSGNIWLLHVCVRALLVFYFHVHSKIWNFFSLPQSDGLIERECLRNTLRPKPICPLLSELLNTSHTVHRHVLLCSLLSVVCVRGGASACICLL